MIDYKKKYLNLKRGKKNTTKKPTNKNTTKI